MSENMKELLITGFEPFGGETVNPSWEAVKALHEFIGNYHINRMEIAVEFISAAETIIRAAEEIKPDVILCIGQAGGRRGITPEAIGINLRDSASPDNSGKFASDEPVIPGAPAAYFSTVPVKEIINAVSMQGIPCFRSLSAGTYVCNDVLYTLLHHFYSTPVQVGFIHVPFLPEQVKDDTFSLPLDSMVAALTAAIKVL